MWRLLRLAIVMLSKTLACTSRSLDPAQFVWYWIMTKVQTAQCSRACSVVSVSCLSAVHWRILCYSSLMLSTLGLIKCICAVACSTIVWSSLLIWSEEVKKKREKKAQKNNYIIHMPCKPCKPSPTAAILSHCVCFNLQVRVNWTLSATKLALTF